MSKNGEEYITLKDKYDYFSFVRKNIQEIAIGLKEESDRAIVILGVAKIDYLLEQILISKLISNTSREDELFSQNGPLSNFFSKIQMCYRLGINDAEFTNLLNLIRKIRNNFAHSSSNCKLDDSPYKDRVNELLRNYQKTKIFSIARETFFPGDSSLKNNFRTMVFMIIISLEYKLITITQIEPIEQVTIMEFLKIISEQEKLTFGVH